MNCPNCGNELDENDYCSVCMEFFSDDDENNDMADYDYESLIDNGDSICLNCTYWSVSPYGSAHGMYCRRGNGQTEPTDTCFDFVKDQYFANYGDSGQYQFDETRMAISSKLFHWRNSR